MLKALITAVLALGFVLGSSAQMLSRLAARGSTIAPDAGGGSDPPDFTTDGCTPAAMQSAIDAATNGDTILMTDTDGSSPCTVNWSTGFVSTGKGVTIDLNGSTITRTSGSTLPLFTVTLTDTMFRLTNGTFVQSAGTGGGDEEINNVLVVDGEAGDAKFRVDHTTMTSTAAAHFLTVRAWGLIDNNEMSSPNNSEMIHIRGIGSWTDDITPGGPDALYIEDNVFTNNGSSNANSSVQTYDGARVVYRYNTMNQTQIDVHGTAGQIGGRWFEIYENEFNNPSGAEQIDKFADLRGGSGVVFNNHLVTGSKDVIFREEDSGTWPRAYQIGSGYNGGTNGHSTCTGSRGDLLDPSNTAPVYVWNNDMPASIGNSQPGTLLEGRDWIESAEQPSALFQVNKSTDDCTSSYSYTPYTYPHPLRGGS